MTGKRQYRSTQRTEAAQATRDRVLATARELFAERGIDKITIDEIARSAGVSAPTIYAQFKSKDGLLQAIML
jgi:AcrR family transcriptional regulator